MQALSVNYENNGRYGVSHAMMHHKRFTLELLDKLEHWLTFVRRHQNDIQFAVLRSGNEGVFNWGGDLKFFHHCIQSGDEESLRQYALKCIRVGEMFANLKNVTTIALIEGDAFGGGFEAALTADYRLASGDVKLGFPEINFNLFPGMGAVSYLKQWLSREQIHDFLYSGTLFDSKCWRDLGVVDRIFRNGVEYAEAFMDEIYKKRNGVTGINHALYLSMAPDRGELDQIATLWVEKALQLSERDLKIIKRLADKG